MFNLVGQKLLTCITTINPFLAGKFVNRQEQPEKAPICETEEDAKATKCESDRETEAEAKAVVSSANIKLKETELMPEERFKKLKDVFDNRNNYDIDSLSDREKRIAEIEENLALPHTLSSGSILRANQNLLVSKFDREAHDMLDSLGSEQRALLQMNTRDVPKEVYDYYSEALSEMRKLSKEGYHPTIFEFNPMHPSPKDKGIASF